MVTAGARRCTIGMPMVDTQSFCAVHDGASSVGTCARCGNFVCTECRAWNDRCRTCGPPPLAWESWRNPLRAVPSLFRTAWKVLTIDAATIAAVARPGLVGRPIGFAAFHCACSLALVIVVSGFQVYDGLRVFGTKFAVTAHVIVAALPWLALTTVLARAAVIGVVVVMLAGGTRLADRRPIPWATALRIACYSEIFLISPIIGFLPWSIFVIRCARDAGGRSAVSWPPIATVVLVGALLILSAVIGR